jgi:hypothetical protein
MTIPDVRGAATFYNEIDIAAVARQSFGTCAFERKKAPVGNSGSAFADLLRSFVISGLPAAALRAAAGQRNIRGSGAGQVPIRKI